MPAPVLLIVSGPPGTGKTTLARQLAAHLRLPLYSRDAIKESLFDTMGWSDRQRSKELGAASVGVLFTLLTDALTAGASCLTESNFRPVHANADFRRLLTATGARAIQIQCTTDGPALVERFAARSLRADRHPGHCDEHNLEEFRTELLAGRYAPLDLPGPVLTWDTTDVTAMPAGELGDQLAALIGTDPPAPT